MGQVVRYPVDSELNGRLPDEGFHRKGRAFSFTTLTFPFAQCRLYPCLVAGVAFITVILVAGRVTTDVSG